MSWAREDFICRGRPSLYKNSFYVHLRMKSSCDDRRKDCYCSDLEFSDTNLAWVLPRFRYVVLAPSEGAAYREIRLEALGGSPEAFGSTYEAESVRPLEAFFRTLWPVAQSLAPLAAPELVGHGGDSWAEKARRMLIRAIFGGCTSRPGARNAGVGRNLRRPVIDYARQTLKSCS